MEWRHKVAIVTELREIIDDRLVGGRKFEISRLQGLPFPFVWFQIAGESRN